MQKFARVIQDVATSIGPDPRSKPIPGAVLQNVIHDVDRSSRAKLILAVVLQKVARVIQDVDWTSGPHA